VQRTPARGRASWFAEAESICSRGLWGVLESLDGRRAVCGLVPDGNSCVRLQLRAGGTHSLPTVEGGVVVDEIELISAIGFADACVRRPAATPLLTQLNVRPTCFGEAADRARTHDLTVGPATTRQLPAVDRIRLATAPLREPDADAAQDPRTLPGGGSGPLS